MSTEKLLTPEAVTGGPTTVVTALPHPAGKPAPRSRVWPLVQEHAAVVLAFVLVVVIAGLPVFELILNTFNTAALGQAVQYGLANWEAASHSQQIWGATITTLALGITRTVIAIPLALCLAWLIARTDLPGREVLEILCWLGIFLPILPLTFAWILLLDPQTGLVNTLLRQVIGVAPFNIYSFWGITWVHLASYSLYFPVILLLPFLRRMAPALEEAAQMSGASNFKTLARVTAPILAPAVLLIGILTFMRSLQSFEVELVLGLPAKLYVYSTLIYDLAREEPPLYGQASALGAIFVALLLAFALFQQWYVRGRDFTTVTGRAFRPTLVHLGRWRYLASAVCFLYLAISTGVPLVFLVLGSFMRRFGFFTIPSPFTTDHWNQLFADPAFLSSVRNTLVICIASALIVVLLYSMVALVVVRSRTALARVTDALVWLPWAVPGILLSLAVLWMILATPLRGILYGSLTGIIFAMVVTAAPLSMQLFKAAILQIGRELEESATMSGAPWRTVYRRVTLPLIAPTAMTVGVLSLLTSSRDIATPVLLYNSSTEPLSVLMLEYSTSLEFERAAAIGVLLMAFALVVMLGARRVGLTLRAT